MFTGCEFKANDRVGFFNHVPAHDGEEQVKVLEFFKMWFVPLIFDKKIDLK